MNSVVIVKLRHRENYFLVRSRTKYSYLQLMMLPREFEAL